MKRIILVILIVLPLLIFGVAFSAGSLLTAPAQTVVGNCSRDLSCENIEFPSESGSSIKGWFVKGEENKGVIVLMHGLRGNRNSLIDRMRFLNKNGYSILSFDFQASGESAGKQITFGYLESRDAEASIKFLRQKLPNEKIGVIGISMGGAAFLLQKDPQKVDALIVEMVYPALETAVKDRLNLTLFDGADFLSPLLTFQFPMRVGISVDEMRPIDKISTIQTPKLFIVGEKDKHTTLEESKQLFDAATESKEIWIVENAEHSDFYKISPKDYEEKVLNFFKQTLQNSPPN